MKKATLILSSLINVLYSCSNQSGTEEVYNKDFNWTIIIPKNFERISPEQWEKIQSKPDTAIGRTAAEAANQAKAIFVFKNGEQNFFESYYQPFKSDTDGDYLISCETEYQKLYDLFSSEMREIKIDTVKLVRQLMGCTCRLIK